MAKPESAQATSKRGTGTGRGRTRNPRLVALTSREKPKEPATSGIAPKAEQLRLEAYAKLGVTSEAVAQLPMVSPVLEASLPGGISEAIGFLRTSDNKDARAFLKVYDELSPTDRHRLPFEAFCLAASIDPARMLGLVVESCYTVSRAAGSIIASINHPKVVEATVKAALYLNGHQDRKMLHTARGFLPVPKNNTFVFQPGAQQNNTQNNTQNNIEANQHNYAPGSVNAIEGRLAKITDRYNQRMGLVPVEATAEPADVEELEPLEPEPTEDESWD